MYSVCFFMQKTDEQIIPDNEYQMSGNKISVKTLDLNLDFSEIAAQLNRIVEQHFELSVPSIA